MKPMYIAAEKFNPFDMRSILTFLLLFITIISSFSQNETDRINIYIDCQMRCARTYIKEEIRYVNYMQDRFEADVYILATRQRTGSGGNEIRLAFSGNHSFEGMNDTLVYQLDPDVTDAVGREIMVKNLEKGLIPFLLKTSMADKIEFAIEQGEENEEISTKVDDPWNFWVFNIGGNAFVNGEASFSGSEFSGRFSASRVTDASKFSVFTRYNYERERFDLGEEEEFIAITTRYFNHIRYILSIDDHWSAGLQASGGSSSFGNTDVEASLKPAVEYNIYPYNDASTRRLTFNYSIGPEYKDYAEATVFDKLSETVVRHNLRIEFIQTQKWGELEIDAGVSQYLHDPELYSMFINPNLEWIITKGLRVDVGGFLSFVGDRINIAKTDLTDEEILLQTKQLDTDYTYHTYIGLNYRFGSKYNNFVNPRF